MVWFVFVVCVLFLCREEVMPFGVGVVVFLFIKGCVHAPPTCLPVLRACLVCMELLAFIALVSTPSPSI